MRGIILIIGFILSLSFQAHSQIKYEGTVMAIFKTFQLEDGTVKYIRYNKDLKRLLIYNLDHTLWRNIDLPLSKDHELDEIRNISIHTFNKDDLVEVAYSCYAYHLSDNNYNSSDGSVDSLEFTINIINEKGKSLLQVPGANNLKIIQSQGVKKMLIYKQLGKGFGREDENMVYSLPPDKK